MYWALRSEKGEIDESNLNLSTIVIDTGCTLSAVGDRTLDSYEKIHGPLLRFFNKKIYKCPKGTVTSTRCVALGGLFFQILQGSNAPFLLGTDYLKKSVIDPENNEVRSQYHKTLPILPTSDTNSLYRIPISKFEKQDLSEYNHSEIYALNIETVGDIPIDKQKYTYDDVKKLHEKNYHMSKAAMCLRYPHIPIELIDSVLDNCKDCSNHKLPRAHAPHGKAFKERNECASLDTVYFYFHGKIHAIIHLVDAWSRYSHTYVCEGLGPSARDTIRAINEWREKFGSYPKEIFTDNGTEFKNYEVYHFLEVQGITHHCSPVAQHRSNGFVERHNGILRRIYEKLQNVQIYELNLLSIKDILLEAVLAKNSFIRKIGDTTMSAQRAAFGVDVSWEDCGIKDKGLTGEYIQVREELRKRARDLINLEAEQLEIEKIIKGNRPVDIDWQTGDKCMVLLNEGKNQRSRRMATGMVIGVKGNRVIVFREGSGEIHEVHKVMAFPLPASELLLKDGKEVNHTPTIGDHSTESSRQRPVRRVLGEKSSSSTASGSNQQSSSSSTTSTEQVKPSTQEISYLLGAVRKYAKSLRHALIAETGSRDYNLPVTRRVQTNLFNTGVIASIGKEYYIPSRPSVQIVYFTKNFNKPVVNPGEEYVGQTPRLWLQFFCPLEFTSKEPPLLPTMYIGTAEDSKTPSTTDMPSANDSGYRVIDDDTMKQFARGNVKRRKEIIDFLGVLELRWLSRWLRTSTKDTKEEMRQHLKSYVQNQDEQLYDTILDKVYNIEEIVELFDDPFGTTNTLYNLEVSNLANFYDILKRDLEKDHRQQRVLYPSDNTFELLSNCEQNTDDIAAIRIATGKTRVQVGGVEFNHFDRSDWVIDKNQCKRSSLDERISKNAITITYFIKKDSNTDKNKDAESKKIVLDLPPEILAKGTIQDLDINWFIEHNLLQELREAVRAELQALKDFGVFRIRSNTELTKNQKLMTSRLILAIKTTSLGELKKVKTRFVPRGFPRNDYRSSYIRRDTAMISQEGLYLALQKILNESWQVFGIDYRNAFLQAEELPEGLRPLVAYPAGIPEEIRDIVEEVLGLKESDGNHIECLKAIYGLIDASRNWFRKLVGKTKALGFRQSKTDPALFYLVKDKSTGEVVYPETTQEDHSMALESDDESLEKFERSVYEPTGLKSNEVVCGVIALHVDDSLAAGDETFKAQWSKLTKEFDIGESWEEDPSKARQEFKFLGRDLIIERINNVRRILVSQENYCEKLEEVKFVDSPEEDVKTWRGAIGRLSWIAHKTRPDLLTEVIQSASITAPTRTDFDRLNKTLKRAKYNKGICICFQPINSKDGLQVIGLTDASHNQNKVTESRYGGIFFLCPKQSDFDQNVFKNTTETSKHGKVETVKASPVFWRSRSVKRRVDTIMDVETLSIHWGTQILFYLQSIAVEIGLVHPSTKAVIYNDNKATVSHIKSNNTHDNPRMAVIWGVLRDGYTSNHFGLGHITKDLNLADAFTKLKSPIETLLIKALRLGQLWLPATAGEPMK